MIIEHSGWSQNRGYFRDKYYIDTNKTDHIIRHSNGIVSKQMTEFEYVTRDWNCDGDVYALFGACFEGKYGGKDFYTPNNLVDMILEGEAEIDSIKKI